MTRLVVISLALSLGLVSSACSSDGGASNGEPSADGGTGPGNGNGCVEGFAFDSALGTCTEIVPAAECPAGSMPEIGHAECQPVGWTTPCPEGFTRPPSGWGCVDRFPVPAPRCTGPTREDVTTGTCVPMGDCSAPFPPPGATLFLDDDGIEDATHFRTYRAAAAAAKPGDVIAVEVGTYGEVVELITDDVAIVGRCPEKVVFKGPVGIRAGAFVATTTGVKIRGITITGFVGGVLLEGGELAIDDTLIDGNDQLGVYLRFGAKATIRRSKISNTRRGSGAVGSATVVYDGSVLTLEDYAFVDNYFRHASVDNEGSTLIAKRTVFARNTKLKGEDAAIWVGAGALAKLSQSAILDSVTNGVRVTGANARVELEESVIRRTSGKLAASGGVGVFAADQGSVKLVSSAVTDHPVLGLYAGRAGTVVTSKSVVLGTPAGGVVEFGRGISGAEKGRLEVSDTAVIGCPQSGVGLQAAGTGTFDRLYVKDSRPIEEKTSGLYGGFGLLVEDGSTATVTRSSFVGNALAGMTSMRNANVTAEAVFIRDTKEVPGLTAGSGVQLARSGVMTMKRSALVGNAQQSVLVASGGIFSMTSSTVHGTILSAGGLFGHGVTIFTGASVELVDTAVYDSAGVGLISDGGEARVSGGTFARNEVALHAQNGAIITQSDAAGTLASGEVRISGGTRFVDNASRVGNGVLALPKPPLE